MCFILCPVRLFLLLLLLNRRRPEYEPNPGNITRFKYLQDTHLKLAEDNDFRMTRSHTLEW